jgi:hypothetical protein
MTNLTPLLNAKEVAGLLQVSERTARRLAAHPVDGPRYGALRVRGVWRFRAQRIYAIVTHGREEG